MREVIDAELLIAWKIELAIRVQILAKTVLWANALGKGMDPLTFRTQSAGAVEYTTDLISAER